MAGSVLKLVVDRQNRKLISYNGTVSQIPDLFQSNLVSLQVQIVDPPITSLQNPSIVDMAGYGLRASVGATPTGSSGGPTPLALQDTFTWDAVNKWFTGDLALNTTDINTYIGALNVKAAYFELNLTNAGDRNTVLQQAFNLRAVVDEGTSTAPATTDVYLTKSDILALLAAKLDKVMKSPDGTWARELGIDNNGVPFDNIDHLV